MRIRNLSKTKGNIAGTVLLVLVIAGFLVFDIYCITEVFKSGVPCQFGWVSKVSVGDTFEPSDFELYSADDLKTYYSNATWVVTQKSKVIQIQQYLTLRKTSNTPADVVKELGDRHLSDFDVEKATINFYDKDYKVVENVTSLSQDVPYCVYEYVKWGEDGKEGVGYSYNFTFGDVPVLMVGKIVEKDTDTPYCVYEYVKWGEDGKEGVGYSYNFTFGDVPVLMVGKIVEKDTDTPAETTIPVATGLGTVG